MLDGIGLSEEESRLYRALLRHPSASVTDLAREIGMPDGRAADVLASLEQRGLAGRQGSDAARAVAAPPGIAVRALLAEQERRMDAVRAELVELESIYADGVTARRVPEVVDLVVGGDAVRQRFAQLQAASREQVRALVRADTPFVSAEENAEEERALLRGVQYRVIVESDLLDSPGFLDAAREAYAVGERVRMAPTLPTRMLIVDDDLGLLPMRRAPEETYGALLVHPSSLLDLLIETFEQIWASAELLNEPHAADTTTQLEPLDRSLLSLLIVGLTDTRIAGQLGISPRTVQRRVSALMDLTRVANRFQLGAEAVRRGWV